MESRESSSPMITRAVAAALREESCDGYQFSGLEKAVLNIVGRAPQELAQYLIPRVQRPAALNPKQVRSLNVQELIANRLVDYRDLQEQFPAITVGVGMGGTTAHLASMTGGPFLPQAFVLTLRGGDKDGNVRQYFNLSDELAKKITHANPEVMTIQHYDPVHDGWLTRSVNHLRLKLVQMPEIYRQFIRTRLIPGGDVIYLEGGASWLRYRTGARNVFQVGGWGDIRPEEFLEGSSRLQQYCQNVGFKNMNWQLTGLPLERGPESEWGSEPGLGEALESFCLQEGFHFHRIRFDNPNDFSRLAFSMARKQLEANGIEPAGVLIEMFSQFDAAAVQKSALLPLWLIFNTIDSQEFLCEMVKHFPPAKPVFFSSLATFSNTPDLAPWHGWETALQHRQWINIGTRQSHYPADTLALMGWARPLREWLARQEPVAKQRVSAIELVDAAQNLFMEFNE